MRADSPLRNFDPAKIALYEKENYVAYYQRDWLKLLRASVGMVKESFSLSLWQAIYGAYLIARAEIAFAPYPKNDLVKAKQFIRRFYAFIKQIHREEFDLDRAAELELKWWIVHRQLFGNAENQPLVDALADIYSVAYGVDRARVRDAAYHRAQGMLYSDYWVNQGKSSNSPLLAQEQAELEKSYVLLRAAITT
jgi:hypothetical protein